MLRGRRNECDAVASVLDAARCGSSGVLVVRAPPGMGKSALLAYALENAVGFRLASAAGVESEMELAFAGLHQLCAPLLDGLERLPGPQRGALETAFGLREGPPPDHFLVGLAVLGLLAEAARVRPLLCRIDDTQWLDHASAQTLALAARRLDAEPVAVFFATRTVNTDDELSRLPGMVLHGLSDADATDLLASALPGLDATVMARIVAEAQGNPLALLELPRAALAADLAGGFDPAGGFEPATASASLPGRIEASFRQWAGQLPQQTQRLLLLATAEPTGDPGLLWRASARLGIASEAIGPAEDEGLLRVDTLVRFRHPLVRSAIYRGAPASRRRQVHAALADAVDADVDPDRRAWHRAQATVGPDDTVAAELERCASRAQARGGVAAAAAFLARSAALTLAPVPRAERALAAAQAKHHAGAPEVALELLALPQAEAIPGQLRARAGELRARIAFTTQPCKDTVLDLLSAAHLAEGGARISRQACLEVLGAALYAQNREALLAVAQAIPDPVPSHRPDAAELLLTGWARVVTEGAPAGFDLLKLGARQISGEALSGELGLRVLALACGWVATDWDDAGWHTLTSRYIQLARETGDLIELPQGLEHLGEYCTYAGQLDTAAALIEEADAIRAATGQQSLGLQLQVAVYREEEAAVLEQIRDRRARVVGTDEDAAIRGAAQATAILGNARGRYAESLEAAGQYCRLHPANGTGPIFLEMAEAAARTGQPERAAEAFAQLCTRTQASGTEYALGSQARARALLTHGAEAEEHYREAIERLGRTRMKLPLARTHLLYGEWLRRQHRRGEAREPLGFATAMLEGMGARSFAQRARTELLAAGGQPIAPGPAASVQLTPQETRIASLASEGLTNHEIAARLFLSPHTVDYHLRKVFKKLGITGRGQLHRALPVV